MKEEWEIWGGKGQHLITGCTICDVINDNFIQFNDYINSRQIIYLLTPPLHEYWLNPLNMYVYFFSDNKSEMTGSYSSLQNYPYQHVFKVCFPKTDLQNTWLSTSIGWKRRLCTQKSKYECLFISSLAWDTQSVDNTIHHQFILVFLEAQEKWV